MNITDLQLGAIANGVFQPTDTVNDPAAIALFARYADFVPLRGEEDSRKNELLMRAQKAGGVICAKIAEDAWLKFRVKSNRWGTIFIQNWPQQRHGEVAESAWWESLQLPDKRRPLNLLCRAPWKGAERRDIAVRRPRVRLQGHTLLGGMRVWSRIAGFCFWERGSLCSDPDKLLAATEGFELVEGVRVNRCARWVQGERDIALLARQLTSPDITWPLGMVPHGIALAAAYRAKNGSYHFLRNGRLGEMINAREFVVPGREQTSGPFLTGMLLAKTEGETFSVVCACMQPVVSEECLMPIDSNFERAHALWLMTFIDRVHHEHSTPIMLSRPLSDEKFAGSVFDFTLRRRLFVPVFAIEVGGSGEEQYLMRKKMNCSEAERGGWWAHVFHAYLRRKRDREGEEQRLVQRLREWVQT